MKLTIKSDMPEDSLHDCVKESPQSLAPEGMKSVHWLQQLHTHTTTKTDLVVVFTGTFSFPGNVHLYPSPSDGHALSHHTHVRQTWW